MRFRTVAVSLVILLSIAGAVLWSVDNSAAGQFEELLQRGYAFIAIGASGRNGDLWLHDATDLFVRATVAEPNSAEAHIVAGMGLELRGDIEQAKVHYEAAQELAPALPVDSLIGQMYLRQGELDMARTAFLRSLDVDPESVLSLDGLATISELTGQIDEAIEYRRNVIALLTPKVDPYLNLSQLYLRHDDPEQAFAVLDEIDEDRRSGERYHGQLGLIYEALDQNDRACEELRLAMRLGASDPEVLAALHRLSCVVH